MRGAPPEKRFHAAALAAAQVDDRLVAQEQLVAFERAGQLGAASTCVRIVGPGPSLRPVGPGEPFDDATTRSPLHGACTSCASVTRSPSPPSSSSRKTWTSSASHCLPAPAR